MTQGKHHLLQAVGCLLEPGGTGVGVGMMWEVCLGTSEHLHHQLQIAISYSHPLFSSSCQLYTQNSHLKPARSSQQSAPPSTLYRSNVRSIRRYWNHPWRWNRRIHTPGWQVGRPHNRRGRRVLKVKLRSNVGLPAPVDSRSLSLHSKSSLKDTSTRWEWVCKHVMAMKEDRNLLIDTFLSIESLIRCLP